MEFDEPVHGRPTGSASLASESLEDLSVYELKERLEILNTEIDRTKNAIKAKESGQSDADNVFR